MKMTISDDSALWDQRLQCLKQLRESRVDVGLTASASPRSRFLLALHERGSPIMRIPPRPVIAPALARESAREAMAEAMTDAIASAMAGDAAGVQSGLEAAGQAGVEAIHAYIDAGIPPPNSPVTVQGGWIYNRPARKGVPVEGKGFNKPLYDTGQLYEDFDYEVKRRD